MLRFNLTLLILLSFLAKYIFPQEKDIMYMYNGEKSFLFLTVAPERGEYVIISKKDDSGSFINLNDSVPLTAIRDIYLAMEILGADYNNINRILDLDTEIQLIRAVQGNSFNSTLITLIYPSAAVVAGRLYIDESVKKGEVYEYKIEYFSSQGEKLSEFIRIGDASVKLPVAPGNLKVKSVKGIVTLSWDYPKWDENKDNFTTRFNIYRRELNGEFSIINTNTVIRDDNSQNTFTDIRTDDKIRYEYYITAIDPAGTESVPSNKVVLGNDEKVAPEPPHDLTAALNLGRIILYWNISPQENIVGYNLYRKESITGDSIKLNSNLIDYASPQFEDTLINSGLQYFYFVTAVAADYLESRLSSVANVYVEDTSPPLPPSIVKVNFEGGKSIVSIEPSKSKDVTGYRIYRGESNEILPLVGYTEGLSYSDTGYFVTGFTQGGIYYYSVSAVDFSENESERSEIYKVIIPDFQAPPAPSPVTAVLKAGSFIEIFTGTSASSDVSLMKIFRSENTGEKKLLITLKNFPSIFIDENVELLNNYTYFVQSIDTAGNASEYGVSESITVKDLYPPPSIPFLTAVELKPGVKIDWVRVIEPDLQGYNVYRSLLPNGVYEKLNNSPLTETTYFDSSGKKEFFYKVRAIDTSGNESEWSEFAGVEEEM